MSIPSLESFPFHPVIARWFSGHFHESSPPQTQGWPAIAAGEHTLILAPTGSGKTLAAFLWCIDDLFRIGLDMDAKVFAQNRAGVHTLYISPLKALNNDIHYNLQEPLKGIRQAAAEMNLQPPEIRAQVRTGDTAPHLRQAMVKRPPHILITTPESLFLLLTSTYGREMFRHLRYLIVDEIHALSNNKRGVHLSLSIERLMSICKEEPVRIGLSATQRPLERIAAFLGGAKFVGGEQPTPRAVTIVDCGQPKGMDLQVVSPVKDFGNLPGASIWPAVIEKLYKMIREHRTTLVFVNMRAQTEKIARQLNEFHQRAIGDPEAELALAHHGSISREQRYEIEARLKAGKIPAVIATASLELGIDIGSIDLVVQLESPRSVTGALQRIGRSGHLLRATSKGRIIPLYAADLDDAVAIARAMEQGDIEETQVPENCLDVLAQQIVAEVAMRDWSREDLYRLVRQSYCYRNLSLPAFTRVAEMLSGQFADHPIPGLKPRIAWDKINDRLIGRKGARLLATTNGGTIPDRAYYSVHLQDGTKLGEMEEEFAFESRVGDVFFLGSSEWLIREITQDRIIVDPMRASKPRPPFWKGDLLYRDYSTSLKVAACRREFTDHLQDIADIHSLSSSYKADATVLNNLKDYFRRQQDLTEVLPTDRQVVGEWFRDDAGEPHFLLHAPFGARVNGAWAVALCAELENRFQAQTQYAIDDDGIIFRMLDSKDPLPTEGLFALSADRVEELIIQSLMNTPLFSSRFRQNATRALLLRRSRQGQRIPLWLQRLRAADLLQVVRGYPDFPIIVETFRDCLHDVFDLPALRQVIEKLHSGEINLHIVKTPFPSPMASGLMFRFLANHLYQEDHAHQTALAANLSGELLAEILERDTIPTIVSQELAAAAEARWQNLTSETRAKDAEDLFSVIEKLGPLDANALAQRSKEDPSPLLQSLVEQNRILYLADLGWIAAADLAMHALPPSREAILLRLRRILRTRGPVTLRQICAATALPEDEVEKALEKLLEQKLIVKGLLVEGTDEIQWCDRNNMAELYRRAVASRRTASEPASRSLFYRFLLRWHRVGQPKQCLEELMARYYGLPLPAYVFERELLRSRMGSQETAAMSTAMTEIGRLVQQGQIIVRADAGVQFIARGAGHIFYSRADMLVKAQQLPETVKTVFAFLQEHGASPIRDIITGTGQSATQVEQGLSALANQGLASCDDYQAFLLMLQSNRPVSENDESAKPLGQYFSARNPRSRLTRAKSATRHDLRQRMQLHSGRWFLSTSFAVAGKEIPEGKRAESQVRLLLQRYGILIKDWYRRESGLLPWHQLFQTLKRLEWQGEVRRGYFVQGLTGIQFASPEAIALLGKLQTETKSTAESGILLSTVDPALPFGGAVGWDIADARGRKVAIVRSAGNHLLFLREMPVLYSENYGWRLWTLAQTDDSTIDALVANMKAWLRLPDPIRPRKRIEIASVDDAPAAASPMATALLRHGFEIEGEKLALWPSAV